MSEQSQHYQTGDIGEYAVPIPIMAERRRKNRKICLDEARGAADAVRGILVRLERSIRAAEVTSGTCDFQSVEMHAQAGKDAFGLVCKAVERARAAVAA